MKAGRQEAQGLWNLHLPRHLPYLLMPSIKHQTLGAEEWWESRFAVSTNWGFFTKKTLFTFSYFLISTSTEMYSNCYIFKPSFVCKGEELHGFEELLGSKEPWGGWAFGAGREFRDQFPHLVDEKTEALTGVSRVV